MYLIIGVSVAIFILIVFLSCFYIRRMYRLKSQTSKVKKFTNLDQKEDKLSRYRYKKGGEEKNVKKYYDDGPDYKEKEGYDFQEDPSAYYYGKQGSDPNNLVESATRPFSGENQEGVGTSYGG